MASAAAPADAAAGAGRRRIVVAVDEGEESAHALAWCLANVVSPAGGDTLVLVHARRPPPVYAAMDSAGMAAASVARFLRSDRRSMTALLPRSPAVSNRLLDLQGTC